MTRDLGLWEAPTRGNACVPYCGIYGRLAQIAHSQENLRPLSISGTSNVVLGVEESQRHRVQGWQKACHGHKTRTFVAEKEEESMQYLLLIYENEKRFSQGFDPIELREYRAFGKEHAAAIKGGNAYRRALSLTNSAVERRYLRRRLAELGSEV